MWLDEAITVDIARLPPGELLAALRHDGHPPLYYLLLHLWMAVVGDGDRSVRALSGACSLATLPLVWAAAVRIGRGRRGSALVALSLAAASPFAVRYATEARMYSLMGLLAVGGYLAVIRALERPTWLRLALVAVLTAATVLTHYWGLWLVAAALLLLLAPRLLPGAEPVPNAPRAAGAIAVGSLAFAAWLPAAAAQLAHTGTPWAQPAEPLDAVMDTLLDLGGGKWAGGRLLAVLVALVVLVALLALAPHDRWHLVLDLRTVPGVRPELALVGVTLVLGLGVAVAGSSAFQPRYAAAIVPFVLLAVAVGVDRLPHPAARQACVVLLVVLSLAGSVRVLARPKTQGAQVAHAVAQRARPGDVVGYCPDQLRPAVQHALRPQPDVRDVAGRTFPGGSPPGRVDWTDYRERIRRSDPDAFARRLVALAGPNGSIFLVTGERYRGFGEDCTDVRAALDRVRGGGRRLVAPDRQAYERATLRWYPGR